MVAGDDELVPEGKRAQPEVEVIDLLNRPPVHHEVSGLDQDPKMAAWVIEEAKKGVTRDIDWRHNDWRNAAGRPVENSDLWKRFLFGTRSSQDTHRDCLEKRKKDAAPQER